MNTTELGEPTRSQIEDRIANLCKPPGSLGAIEQVAGQLCLTQGSLQPKTRPRSVSVFAADHGVTQEGVSAWPSSVTQSVVQLMQTSRTASGIFSRALDCNYEVIDVGLLRPLSGYDEVVLDRAQRRGSGNLRIERALSEDDFQNAWNVGTERAIAALDAGSRLLIGGEMGIGNTTPATCLITLLCGVDDDGEIAKLVGSGAGADSGQLEQKRGVVQAAVRRVRTAGIEQPKQIGCEVGGLEIAALAGYYTAAAERRCTIIVDGLIATSAALLANAIRPGTRRSMLAGHRSTDRIRRRLPA